MPPRSWIPSTIKTLPLQAAAPNAPICTLPLAQAEGTVTDQIGGSRVLLRLRSVTGGRDSVLSAWEQGPWRLRQYAGPAPIPRTTSRPAPVPSAEAPGLRTLARP